MGEREISNVSPDECAGWWDLIVSFPVHDSFDMLVGGVEVV